VLEALGLDMELKDGDIAARANFCTLRGGVVIDRRAGRLETKETERLCNTITETIPEIEGVKILIKPGKSHRFAVIFRGSRLSDKLTDADPHKENNPYVFTSPVGEDARYSSKIVNIFIQRTIEILKSENMANGVLLRGFSKTPEIPPFPSKYNLKALAIATYPMYRGVAKVLGMDIKGEPRDYDEIVKMLKDNYNTYNFFFIHIKETDLAGEDGNFSEKVKAIEKVDTIIPEIYSLSPQVMVITGDHSTPCLLKGHSWHPVPLLLVTRAGESDEKVFHEKNCITGSIGTIYSKQLMSLALAHGFKLDKYGA
jgi:2,3-bisphosphoglycerate-independent phosphoglycerate mutase